MKIEDKRGFTLVEVLIVIMIVGVVSAMAIGGYSSYRRAALLDLAADNILAQIYQLRESTVFGDFGSERYDQIRSFLETGELDEDAEIVQTNAKCKGLLISKEIGEEDYDMGTFLDEFSGLRIFRAGEWQFTGCVSRPNVFTLGFETRRFEIDENIFVEEILYKNNLNIEYFVMRYLPPEGDLEVSVDGRPFARDLDEEDVVEIVIRYGDTNDNALKRKIIFDLSDNIGFISRVN